MTNPPPPARHAAVPGSFVTAVLGRLDLRTGTCTVINAGHVPPLLVRDGATQPVALPRNFPLGMFDDVDFDAGRITLQPGDRLAINTDGMRERNAADLDLPAILPTLTGLHPGEAGPVAGRRRPGDHRPEPQRRRHDPDRGLARRAPAAPTYQCRSRPEQSQPDTAAGRRMSHPAPAQRDG